MPTIFARLIPFLLLGMAVVAFAFGLILFVYLLIFGALVGLTLFAVNWIKQRFFSSKHMVKTEKTQKDGRTIDHDSH